jgi:hypothetical protein
LEGENIIISRPGGVGIIKTKANINNVPADIDIDETEEKLKNKYGLRFDKSTLIFSRSDLEYVNLLQPISSFGFNEVYDRNENTILAGFGMPLEVYGKGKTVYKNKVEEERAYYQNEIIPLANSFCQGITQEFDLEGLELKVDYSHLECFAQNNETRSRTMINVVNSVEKLSALGYSKEEINEILIDYEIIKK